MTTFEQFIRDRYTELQLQRADLHAQLKAIQKEIDEIEKASRASGLQVVKYKPPRLTSEMEARKPQPGTMKEAAVDVLRKYPDGLTAKEILSEVNGLLGTAYPRSSLSPQLSRLKHDGIVYDTDGRWVLTVPHNTQSSQ